MRPAGAKGANKREGSSQEPVADDLRVPGRRIQLRGQLMGDNSPKNKKKQEEQRHEKEVEKVHLKQENAETQHHPVSGHPTTAEEDHAAEAAEAAK